MFHNKSLFSLIFVTCYLLFANFTLSAQSFIQRLSWTPDEYALRYEVEIEKEEEETYQRQLFTSTEEPSIFVPLLPGKYRYRVTPYNLLNRPGRITEWMYFEIHQPVEIRQPDEDETVTTEIETDLHWPLNIHIGAAWFTLIDLQGENTQSDQFLSGAAIRINAVSSNLSFFNIGLELAPAWYSLNSLFNGEAATQSLFLETNFLLQKQFRENTLALTFRGGAGIILPIHNAISEEYQDKPDTLDNILFYTNTGLSFLWLPLKYLYIEAGVNYSYKFAVNNHTSRLRPWVGIGTRL